MTFLPIFIKYRHENRRVTRFKVPTTESMKDTVTSEMFFENFNVLVFEGLNIVRV